MSEPDALIDSNILLRLVANDHPDHSPRSHHMFLEVANHKRTILLLDTVIFEAVYSLEKHYRVPRALVADQILPLLQLPCVVLTDKDVYVEVFPLWVENRGLSFADCYHLCMTHWLGIQAIMSFDKKMSRYMKVERIEPPPLA